LNKDDLRRRYLRNLTTLSREKRERNPETGEKRMLALNFYAHLTDKYVKASKKQKKDLNNLKDKRKMEKK
jgi:hypothetical protein